jgi:hypothetical protein
MIRLYQPVDYIFENNNKYKKEIKRFVKNHRDYSGISHSLSIKKSIEIMQEYSNIKNEKYDIVILYRPDVILFKDIILKNYNNLKDNIYCNAWNHSNGDFHFVMNYDNAVEFKFLYDSLKKDNKHKEHFWIKNYVLKYMKKKLLMDKIVPPLNQEVLRKLVLKKVFGHRKLYKQSLNYKNIL